MQSFKIPMIMRCVRSGPNWPYFNVMMNILLFLCSPRSIVQSVPRFLFAGTVVRLACDLINEWLLDARRRVSAEEWLVLLATAIAVVINVTLGILFGLFCTLAWFAFEYTNVTGVAHESTLSESRSRVERSENEHKLLQEHGGSTLILWLNGYFFFGLACQVIEQIRETIKGRKASAVILDFSNVPAIDASGVCFNLLCCRSDGQELRDHRMVRVIFSGMARRLTKSLETAAQHQQVDLVLEMFLDLDKAVEFASFLMQQPFLQRLRCLPAEAKAWLMERAVRSAGLGDTWLAEWAQLAEKLLETDISNESQWNVQEFGLAAASLLARSVPVLEEE
eukprot:g19212.t1